jgi:hypothetical protein
MAVKTMTLQARRRLVAPGSLGPPYRPDQGKVASLVGLYTRGVSS